MPAQSKRDILVDVSLNLFKKNGINSTGIDRIIAEAKISKKTLYHHFKSKDKLVLAALRKDDEIGRNALLKYVNKAAEDPVGKMMAIFDFYDLWFNSPSFSGCLFINSAAEIPDRNNASRRLCAEHKTIIAGYLHRFASEAKLNNAKELASQLNLLLEGAIIYAWVMQDKQAAKTAKKMAGIILASQGVLLPVTQP